MAPPSEWGIEPSVCPGYSTTLPTVLEAEEATRWMDRGYLIERYEGIKPTKNLLDAIDYFSLSRDRRAANKLKK